MAESPSVYSARSELSPQDNVNGAVEVDVEVLEGDNWTTPLRRTRLFEGHSEEQASMREKWGDTPCAFTAQTKR